MKSKCDCGKEVADEQLIECPDCGKMTCDSCGLGHCKTNDDFKLKLVGDINDLKSQRRDLIRELSKCHALFTTASNRVTADMAKDRILTPLTAGMTLTAECYKHCPVPAGDVG